MLLVSSVALVTTPPAPSAAAVPGVQVSFAPTTVVDGQAVSVNIKAASPIVVAEARAHLCRAGVDYQPSTASSFAPDFERDGPNCPRQAISTSADSAVTDGETASNAGDPEGETFLFRAGVGVVEWKVVPGGAQASLICDAQNPCALVVQLRISQPGKPTIWQPFVQNLSYGEDNPFIGCGGPAAGVLNTGGSDRASDAWVNWTIGECSEPGRKGAAGRASFVGEGNAVETFARGSLDLAYTGGGYTDSIGLAPSDPALADGGRRAAVNVPTALNATVLAVGGGVRVSGHKVPFRDIKLTGPEVATLLAGGVDAVQPLLPAIGERNPEIAEAGFFDISAGISPPIGAYADAEVTSWYGTRFLKELAPGSWKVPLEKFGADGGRERGIHVSLALADPSFNNAVSLLSGRPTLRKALLGPSPLTAGGIWVLTDLATAKALGLTTVSIANARGDFVAPTPETMLAALGTMTRDSSGILVSDPRVTAPVGEVQPYPMTFVEYAMAPAEPLFDFDCVRRTDSQALLTGWLNYITGPGQAKLPAGMVPLTDGLKAEAATAIPKVGAAAVTGPCEEEAKAAPANQTTTTTTVPATATTTTTAPATAGAGAGSTPPVNDDGGSQAGSSPSPSGSIRDAASPVTTIVRPKSSSAGGKPSTTPAGVTETAAPAASPTAEVAFTPARAPVDIPPFQGKNAVALGGTVLALAGIMIINAGAGIGASPALARVRRVLRYGGRAIDLPPAPGD